MVERRGKPLCPYCGKPVGRGRGVQFVLQPEIHRCPRSMELLLRFVDGSSFHESCLVEFSKETGHQSLEHVHLDLEAEPFDSKSSGKVS